MRLPVVPLLDRLDMKDGAHLRERVNRQRKQGAVDSNAFASNEREELHGKGDVDMPVRKGKRGRGGKGRRGARAGD